MSKQELLKKTEYDFSDLVEIMQILRSDGGCPWDREQTHESIRKNFIEETYEVVEAIDTKDDKLMCEELGDVLLQVVFHARMAEEEKSFDIDNVTTGICKKLIYRHPHIFAENASDTKTSEQVLEKWEQLKRIEKGRKTLEDTLSGVCTSLPALMRTQKLIKKTKQLGAAVTLEGKTEGLTKEEAEIAAKLFEVCEKANDMKVDAEEVLGKLCREYTENSKG